VETICPFCHQKHALSQADIRKQMRCPGCHHTFTANPLTGLGIAVKTPPPSVVSPAATRIPPGMPPMPGTHPPSQPSAGPLAFLSEGGNREPADLLAGYQATHRRSASPLADIAEAVKRPIRVARLRHQVSGLQQALDAAWEKLGMLAIGHRPFHSHLRAELPELSALQQQAGAKQSMADSLRQTKGSNAMLREVEAELAELRDRQRRLMIAIGQKAEAGTPGIPDGPAHYAAVKRLRSTLESAEHELLIIVQPLRSSDKTRGALWVASTVLVALLLIVISAVAFWPTSKGKSAGKVLVDGEPKKLHSGRPLIVGEGGTQTRSLKAGSYSIDYKISHDGEPESLTVTINGPAAKLAAILAGPRGEPEVRIITNEELIANRAQVSFSPFPHFQVGTYALTVKMVDPEEIVYQEKVTFSPTELTAEDLTVTFIPLGDGYNQSGRGLYIVKEIAIVMRKTGNLPIDRLVFEMNGSHLVRIGETSYMPLAMATKALADKRLEARSCSASRDLQVGYYNGESWLFQPGQRVLAKVSLSYLGGKYVQFQKEVQPNMSTSEATEPTPLHRGKRFAHDVPPGGHARSTKIDETQPESAFLGEWTNRDFQTLGITRIHIIRARGSNRIVVRLWTKSKGPMGEWNQGETNATLGNNVLSVNQTPLGDADRLEMTLLENGDMQVDAHPRFSGRESVDHISGKSVFGKGLVHDWSR
jgi:hypothetical protein